MGELQCDTMFYLNTSLRSHSCPMGVLDGSCLHLIWEATDSFLFLSPMETDVAALLSFPFCRDFMRIHLNTKNLYLRLMIYIKGEIFFFFIILYKIIMQKTINKVPFQFIIKGLKNFFNIQ